MVDERRIDETFRVVLSEETEIIENLEHFILLTGEAGDGKSHLLRSLGQRLSDYRFQIYQDFSSLSEEKRVMPIDDRQELGKKELIKLIADIIEGKSEQRIIIAVYDKGNVSKIERFDISNYAVDLFAKGYPFCGEGNIFTKLDY